MLQFLHIENIAVIENANIELGNGFNVLTGETGAGKSIIIDSINAVLGMRTSKELIREGAQKAEVSAVFSNLDSKTLEFLDDNGYSADQEGQVIISRTLSSSGNVVKINGKPATVGILKDIGQLLVNIHGQHDNQSLLNPQNHCGYIDLLAENDEEITEYYEEFKKLNSIRKELISLETDEDEKLRKTELLKYQINELTEADIKIGEIEDLKEKQKLAQEFEKTANIISNLDLIFNGDDSKNGLIANLKNADKLMASIKSKESETISAKITDAVFMLDDIVENIRLFAENNEFSQEDADIIGERLDLLRKIVLKYGGTEENALKYLTDAKNELSLIVNSDKRINELSDELDLSTERLILKAEKLTNSRKKAAEIFEQEVTDVLKYLDMPNVVFKVGFIKGRYTKNGCDEIEFLISANAGESVKPLHKIASGGELSRVMLAIKSVLSEKDVIDTLVFDEIDSGISGSAASKVAVQLGKVSKNRQVICVTHLAQIASFADNHLLIKKTTENGRVYTNVTPLSYDERIKEIARIMSGNEITENLYNTAKELLDRSKTYENL